MSKDHIELRLERLYGELAMGKKFLKYVPFWKKNIVTEKMESISEQILWLGGELEKMQ